jgi:FAD/FMN-containing dehydrogenase
MALVATFDGRQHGSEDWRDFAERVGDRLIAVESPLAACMADRSGPACAAALEDLRNPFFIEDHPGAFHTTGWLGAFESRPGPYAVAAGSADDLAAAVEFAAGRQLSLVVKGTGHDYLGRSSAADALTVWTHHMRDVTVHDAFAPMGSPGPSVPAVSVGAGTRWLEVYQAVSARGLYAQGGGCTSVGAAGGFTQGGGFGSFSKCYGTAAGSVLEIEVVTADGRIVVANENHHPDLFWALRGGGGATFGVVSRMTLALHPMPGRLGAVFGSVAASNDTDFGLLVRRLVEFFPEIDDPHFGEQIRLYPDRRIEFTITVINLDDDEVRAVWAPFLDWVAARSDRFSSDVVVGTGPFERSWDPGMWDELLPSFICRDRRPGASGQLFWWSSNQGEVSQFIEAYKSRWLPADMFVRSPGDLADALVAASRLWPFSIHANKGLAGASPEARRRDAMTSINPAAFEAAALVIMASVQQYAYPGVPGLEPDLIAARERAQQIEAAMAPIRAVTPNAGTYVNEADYFEADWQTAFWGTNYERLLEIKGRYDPTNLFRVHHGVGSEL